MTRSSTNTIILHSVRSGIIAGTISAIVFSAIHDIFMSDIWSSLVMLLVAGAACGLGLSWSYGLLNEEPSLGRWLERKSLLHSAAVSMS